MKLPKSQKGSFLPMLGVIVLVFVIGIGAFYLGSKSSNQQTSKAVPDPKPTNISRSTFTKTRLGIYKLEVNLPEGWEIKELNRRSEPQNEYDPKQGHDCADYTIFNKEKDTSLLIKFTCGYSDGGSGDPWLADAVIIKEKSPNNYILRYFNSTKSIYTYSDGNKGYREDSNGKREQNFVMPIITFGTGENLYMAHIELKYNGTESIKESRLSVVDELISSISRI